MSFQKHKFTPPTTTAKLSDVLDWAKTQGESSDALYELEKVPARLGLVDDDLAALSADMRYFEKKIAPAPYGAVSKAKNLNAARKRANARLRALLNRYHAAFGNSRPQTGRADWDVLIDWVKNREGFVDRGALFSTGTSLGLTTLRSRCAVPPCEVSQTEVQRIQRETSSAKRKAVSKGLSVLNRLIFNFANEPDLAGLLPPHEVALMAGSDRATRILWDSLPPNLRASAETSMDAAVAGPKERVALAMARIKAGESPEVVQSELNDMGSGKRKTPKNPEAAKAGYRQAITWLLRAAEVCGHSRNSIPDLNALMTADLIEAACQQQIERSEASDELKDSSESQTLGKRLTDLRTIAGHGMGRSDLVALIDMIRLVHSSHVLKPGAKHSDEADMVCRQVQNTPHLAASYVNSPKRIADDAESNLRDARESDCTKLELSALRLYATAVFFAVQVSRPVRPANLIRLRHRSTPDVTGNLEWREKGKHAVLRFKEREIKNSRTITVHIEGNEARILWKWLTEYRARFIELKGIEDSVYVIPGEAEPRLQKREANLPNGCVAPSTMSEIWADGAEIIGVGLTAHQARHVTATLILAMEPGNFAKVASVLGNSEEICRKHYGRDSGEDAARAVRSALKAKHPAMFRNLQRRAVAWANV